MLQSSWRSDTFEQELAINRKVPAIGGTNGSDGADILVESIEIRRRVSALLENCLASSAMSAASAASHSPAPDDRAATPSSHRASTASASSRGSGARPQHWWDDIPSARASPKPAPASPPAGSATRWWEDATTALGPEPMPPGGGALSEGRAYLLELTARLDALEAAAAAPPLPSAAVTAGGGGWASTLTGEAELQVGPRPRPARPHSHSHVPLATSAQPCRVAHLTRNRDPWRRRD
jgi:hypothetical protein